MSDTPTTPNPDDQPETPPAIQPPPEPPIALQPSDLEAGDIKSEEPAPSIEGRMLLLGDGGRAFLDVVNGILDTLEEAGRPSLLAGSFGFIFKGPGTGDRSEFGCIASEFGNDLLLKGLSGTINEQRLIQAQRRRAPQGALSLQDLLAMIRGSNPQGPIPTGKSGSDAFCNDPACPDCADARAAAGAAQPPAAGPTGGPDEGPTVSDFE